MTTLIKLKFGQSKEREREFNSFHIFHFSSEREREREREWNTLKEGAPEQPSREAWRLRLLRQWQGDVATSDLPISILWWGLVTSDDDDLDWVDLRRASCGRFDLWRASYDRSDLHLLASGSSGIAMRDWV